jgi:CarD family transcriptional regulator
MYQKNQYVVYGSHGVCQIADIEEKNIDHKAVQYYVLEPLSRPGAMYYVPVHNAVAVGKMRLPLTRERILSMAESQGEDVWIAEENQRRLRYRELIGNTDPVALFSMVRRLRQHRQEQLELGRKFHVLDANFLKDAELLLAAEFAFVLDMDKEEAFKMF